MAREIWPFRRAGSATIEFEPWHLSGLDPVLLPEYLEGWDPLTDVHVDRVVRCDLHALKSEAGLAATDELILSVSWVNRQSFMTESVYRADLGTDQLVQVALPASRLGGSVTLRTTVVVATTDLNRPLGVARWAGSVLASHEQIVILEGTGPMFPIAEVDFAGTVYPPYASWALQLPDDPSLPVLGSVLLLVNSRDRELISALAASKPDTRQAAILENLEGQLASFLIEHAAVSRAELESEVWSEQSVGEILIRYLAIGSTRGLLGLVGSADRGMLASGLDAAARAEGFGRGFS